MNQQNRAPRTMCPSTRRDIDIRAKVLNNWSHRVLQDRTICAVLFSVAQMRLGNSSCSPSVADLVLEHLCPAIQNILEDGLRDHKLDYVIGQSRNHSWKVVEISTRIGTRSCAFMMHEVGDDMVNLSSCLSRSNHQDPSQPGLKDQVLF